MSEARHFIITSLGCSLRSRVEAAGWQIHNSPLQSITNEISPRRSQRLLATLRQWQNKQLDAVFFVSPSAVKAVDSYCEQHNIMPSEQTPLAFMGATSKAHWTRAATDTYIAKPHQDSNAFADELIQRLPKRAKVVIFRAQNGREQLPRKLRKAGFSVACVTSYMRFDMAPENALGALSGRVVWYVASSMALRLLYRYIILWKITLPIILASHPRIVKTALGLGWPKEYLYEEHTFEVGLPKSLGTR